MKVSNYHFGENRFVTDLPSLTWQYKETVVQLWDDTKLCGVVYRTIDTWVARPHWEQGNTQYFFDTQDEAKAFLLTVYRMEGERWTKKN